MEIKLSINSVSKANPNYERVVYPIEGDKKFKVTIVPIKNFETTNYAKTDNGIDLKGVLVDHVKKIEGLTLVFSEDEKLVVKDVAQLLELPRVDAIETILQRIFLEITSSGTLTEDEEKN